MVLDIFIFLSIVRVFYWLSFFQKLGSHFSKASPCDDSVSIIVCAKNEYKNLQTLIPILLDQSYTNVEVIVVDDYSSDDTVSLQSQYPSVNWVKPSQDVKGKKYALAEGIQCANNPWILLTDADCQPNTDWAKTMMVHKQDNDMLLGFSPMKEGKGFINMFSSYETLYTALQYLTYAIKGMPYMGVGRNLLYKKSLFEKVNGFERHKNILSGDDDLFIQSVLPFAKVGICIEPKSWVYTFSEKTLSAFLRQKVRHTSTSFAYQWKHKALLSVFAISHMLWLVGFVVGLFIYPMWSLMIAVVTWGIMTIVHHRSFENLGGKKFIWTFPIMDIFIGIYYWSMSIFAALFSHRKMKTWN